MHRRFDIVLASLAILLAAAVLVALAALGLAWATGGSRFVTAGSLARAPLYILWKLPMYLSFARHGTPKDWNRTDRGAA